MTPDFNAQGPGLEPSLYAYYKNTFRVLVADTPELQEICFRLRYHVYCLENPYEPSNPMEMEKDVYDENAIHFLLQHKGTGLFVGTTRVIRRHQLAETSDFLPPPVFRLCEQHGIPLPPEYTPETSFEVSRFAVSKTFRRRLGDAQYPVVYSADELDQDKKRIIPCMTLGLIAAIYQTAVAEREHYCCVIMAPTLLRLLTKLGILFMPQGQPIEYHGTRQIYTIHVPDLVQTVGKIRPEVLDIFTDGGRFLPDTGIKQG